MARIRLREARPTEEETAYYARVYPDGYRHDRWPDHIERVWASVELIRGFHNQIATVADLSCGDAAIVRGLVGMKRLRGAYLGDLNGSSSWDPGGWGKVRVRAVPAGPLPDTLVHLDGKVDLFVLSETIEHMDDPDALLRALTGASRYLFLSTPISEIPTSGNLEHYWSWGTEDVHDMLMDNGWVPLEKRELVPQSTLSLEHAYHYQLWMAVAR